MSSNPSGGFSDKPPVSRPGFGGFSDEAPAPKAGEPASEGAHAEGASEGDPEPDIEQMTALTRILELQEQGQRGANWFFWVAGLSVVNSVTLHAGVSGYFVVGLGITLIVDGVAKGIGQQHADFDAGLKTFAIGFAIVAALCVSAFGWFARQGFVGVFAVGMALYLLDGLFFLALDDLMSAAFHVFALFWMWSGLSAFREAHDLESALREQIAAHEPHGD
ncbi:MAG: hypothetical protein HYR84_12705 [Planctomycetes bacterium]|nr:hypothetical protein [Planctomycetota bacterium]